MGAKLPPLLCDRSRQYCDACLPEYREAQSTSFSDAGGAKLKELRAEGMDPSHTGEATEKRRTIMRRRRQEEIEWDATHSGVEIDEEAFRADILPGLQCLSLTQIASETGLSQQYCSLIRRGLKVPHRRHWQALTDLVSEREP